MGCSSSKALADDVPLPQADFFDKHTLGDVLGRGAYGTVRVAYCMASNERLAVKILDVSGSSSWPGGQQQLPKDVRAEQKAWTRIGGHPNVVGFRESFLDGAFAYFVMELCSASLFTAWKREPDLNEYTYARYFKEMARALAHIHSVGVVHRDVKQDNFMAGAPDARTVKLCDFGLSAVIVGGRVPSGQCGQVGTAPYMAPEMVSRMSTHGPPADVWSFGVIVYTAFFGCWPYPSRRNSATEIKKAIQDGMVRPSFAPHGRLRSVVSPVAICFVKELLDRNPVARPSAASCLGMDYLDPLHGSELQVNGKYARMISLAPHLDAAKHCGAFNVKTPIANLCQQRHLMKLQINAQSRRESCSPSPRETGRATMASSDDVGADPRLYQPRKCSAEEVGNCGDEGLSELAKHDTNENSGSQQRV